MGLFQDGFYHQKTSTHRPKTGMCTKISIPFGELLERFVPNRTMFTMQTVEISLSERESGEMREATLNAAVEAIIRDGVVLLPQMIDVGHVDALGEKMQADIRRLSGAERFQGSWSGIRPPPFAPYLFKDIVYNEMAIAVTHRIMGDGVALDSYGANTAFKGDQAQSIHSDTHQLWPHLEVTPPPHCIVVNVCLSDVDETNGGTKIWPGTHTDNRIVADNRRPTADMVAEWEERRPPEQVHSKKGDLILRDMRVWHCGMPNTTDTPRVMLAMIHRPQWAIKWGFEAEKGSEGFFDHPILDHTAVFLERPIDYLHQGHSQPRLTPATVSAART